MVKIKLNEVCLRKTISHPCRKRREDWLDRQVIRFEASSFIPLLDVIYFKSSTDFKLPCKYLFSWTNKNQHQLNINLSLCLLSLERFKRNKFSAYSLIGNFLIDCSVCLLFESFFSLSIWKTKKETNKKVWLKFDINNYK